MITIFLSIPKPKQLIAEDGTILPEPVMEVQNKDYTKAELLEKVYYYSEKYSVSANTMIEIINCENRDWDTNLQSRIINSKGEREDSWGLAQWHLPSKNKTKDGRIITKEIATNPNESLENMAWYLSEGHAKKWTCARKLKLV